MQQFSAAAAETDPPNVFLPWLLDDATDDDIAFYTGSMPDSVRAELQSEWIPRWLTKVNALGLVNPCR